MKDKFFKISIIFIAVLFTFLFSILVIPPFLKNPDILGAFGAGFVNPYSSGYSIDTICCWFILFFWVLYEYPKVKYGWVCLLLGIVPGVAVGFALYLLLRMKQIREV